jgi:hypothetical protein
MLTVTLGFFAAGLVLPTAAANASCVGPELSVSPTSAAVGEPVEVRGRGFGTACNDTTENGETADRPLGDPDPHVQLRIAQHGLTIPLARLGANDDYEFAVRVTVPGGMQPGPATIESPTSRGVAIVVDPRAGPPTEEPPPTVLAGTTYGVERGGSDDRSPWAVVSVVVIAIAAIGLAVIGLRRRRGPGGPS